MNTGAKNQRQALTVGLRVQFADCDSAGCVSESAYWRYYQTAEDELFRSGGVRAPGKTNGVGCVFPRVAAACRYHAPAYFDEALEVRLRVTALTSYTFTLQFEVWRLEDQILCVDGTTKICALRQPWEQLVRLPDEVRTLLASHAGPRLHA